MNETLRNLLLEYNAEYAKNLWPGTLYNFLCLVVGLFGNGYVLFVYKFKLKDKGESRYFIPYLAVADASTSFVSCFAFIFDSFHYLYYPWDYLCRAMQTLHFLTGFVSIFLLLAIAVQRHTMIKPSGKRCTLFRRRASIGAILIFSVLLSIPFLLITGVDEGIREYNGVNLTSIKCGLLNGQYPNFETYYYILIAAAAVLTATIMFGLYVPIAVVVHRRYRTTKRSSKIYKSPAISEKESTEKTHGTELDSNEATTSNVKATDKFSTAETMESSSSCCMPANAKSGKTRKVREASPSTNFNVMFMTIMGLFVLTHLPMVVIVVSELINGGLKNLSAVPLWKLQLLGIFARTYVINNIVNPFIYGYFDMQFRKYVKDLFCFCCRKL